MTHTLRQTVSAAAAPSLPEQRATEILDSARRSFSEKGFDGASMNDIARQAGMSVGNFYRYFPSKDAIVQALIARDLDETRAAFHAIIGAPDPMEALRQTIRARIGAETCERDGALWAEMNAAAARRPEIAAATRAFESEIVRLLCIVFARTRNAPIEETAGRFRGHAKLILLLIKGSGMCHPDQIADSSDLRPLVLRMIDTLLTEILTAAKDE